MAESAKTPNAAAPTHPLQDTPADDVNVSVSVDAVDANILQQQQQSHTQTKNWVRFDDESTLVAAQHESGSVSGSNKLAPPTTTKARSRSRSRSPHGMRNDADVAAAANVVVAAAPALKETITKEAQPAPPAAVLSVESNYVDLNAPRRTPRQQEINQKPVTTSGTAAPATKPASQSQQQSKTPPATIAINMPAAPVEAQPAMRTIELSTGRVREGFANGDVIVTLLPANTKWPWITPAVFRPELVPEELMAQGLTLTVEDYVAAMETLVNDYRFTAYNICYKRVLVCWILFAFAVLLTMLFSGLQGAALFSLGVFWLFLNAAAIFICMWIKLRLSRGLEKCLARVNKQLVPHKILLILDDRGRISCHKVNLCFLYFDATQCVSYLNEFLEHTEQNGGETIKAGWEAKLDIELNDIVIQGSRPTRLSRKTAVAQEFFLTYLQRWGKDFLRRRLDWIVQENGVHEMPRHLQSSICPCQYEEEILRNKIKSHLKRKQCCGVNCLGCWL